ncbi:hypothetical protein [Pantoea agglomerans]|uniref:hypothetical protein n=1 Tax=Enterobacter agglomerans TaxID=549 RepID=UPI0006DD4393|nr:hypothetical protein [Pantoea agglomerans]KPA08541.1 hypothetical protein PAP10c_0580 [Pantoea agglomerans]
MKLEIKKIINEVPLHCIASFVVGAYTILLINYFWFNNDITPPGVSAFVASMALLFTIYAAFKVKEWSEQKINDKAFKHAEEIIELLNKCYRDFSVGAGALVVLSQNKQSTISPTHIHIAEFNKRKKDYQFKVPEILNMLDTLKMWKFTTHYKERFELFVSSINNFDKKALAALKELQAGDANATKNFQNQSIGLDQARKDVINAYKALTNLTFDKLFMQIK